MGFTHFDKVSAANGIFRGAAGSEISLPTGVSTSVSIAQASTAEASMYTVAPIAGAVTGYTTFSVSAGTGRQATVTLGSAGAILLDTTATGVTGTIGAVVTMTNTSGTTTVTAGQPLLVTLASCATAQVQVGVTLVFTPTA